MQAVDIVDVGIISHVQMSFLTIFISVLRVTLSSVEIALVNDSLWRPHLWQIK